MLSLLYSPPLLVTLYFCSEFFVLRYKRADAFAENRDHGSRNLLIAALLGSLALARLAKWLFPQAQVALLEQFAGVGALLFFMGLALRWIAIVQLGRHFTIEVAILQGHRLIDRGAYRFVRHPSYSGLLLMYLGIGICSANGLALLLILLPMYLALHHRMGIEEAALQSAFGDDYRAYMAHSWRLLPWVY